MLQNERDINMNERDYSILLKNAVSDYAANKDNITISDWLTAFLTDKMTDRDPEQIKESVNTIISTIDSLTALRNDMYSKIKAGKTPEGWFADTVLSQKHENSYVARLIAKMREGLNKAFEEHGGVNEKVIDIIPDKALNDGKWNEERLRINLKKTAEAACQTAIASFSDDNLPNIIESGLSEIAEEDPVVESLIIAADRGLKTVLSGVSLAAKEYIQSIVPIATDDDIAALSDTCIETVSSLAKVAKGEYDITKALNNIKNTAIVNLTNTLNRHKDDIKEAVHTFFGEGSKTIRNNVVSTIGSVVKGEIKLSEVVKKVAPAAKTFIKENAGKLVTGAKNILGKIIRR